ncbi:MAG: 30S ribosomal protein S17 [Pyrinomonadaceae bacterium]
MPRKKKEELEAEEGNAAEVSQDEATNENVVEAAADETAETAAEEKPKRTRKAKADDAQASETAEEPSFVDSVINTVSTVAGSVADAVSSGVSTVVSAVTGDSTANGESKSQHSKRAEKIGIVQSDKMTKTVTVRVDRVVKHPVYRKYIKRRKKFMAHDELGATIGDKVRIMETRPLSAKKRWRVMEIIQKAEK